MIKKSWWIVLFVLSAAFVFQSFSVQHFREQNKKLISDLSECRELLSVSEKKYEEIGKSTIENANLSLQTEAKMKILGKMVKEGSGMQSLCADIIKDLFKIIGIQKTVISRGTAPDKEEEAAIISLEINVQAATKTISVYSQRISDLHQEIIGK